jgi:hypothetical protein
VSKPDAEKRGLSRPVTEGEVVKPPMLVTSPDEKELSTTLCGHEPQVLGHEPQVLGHEPQVLGRRPDSTLDGGTYEHDPEEPVRSPRRL